MVEVKVLYTDGEEEEVRIILNALEEIHRKRFFFSWLSYKLTLGMLKKELEEEKVR
jgi:hypothetical protein